MSKAWHEYLLDFLAGLLTEKRLREAGAGPDAMGTSVTIRTNVPTFSGNEGPPAGLMESRDLAHCHPVLRARYLALKADFAAETGRALFETCTYRSKERQQELYQQGRRGIPGERTVTQLDGVTKRSRHQRWPSEAVDVAVDTDPGPGKVVVWDRAAYVPLGALCARHGLVWGGNWAMDDYPHLEMPAGAA